jgi:antitoxin component YwqK of YwqJK toxin-antitoxin module
MRLIGIFAIVLLLSASGVSTAAEWVQESPGQKAYYDSRGQLERLEIDADRDGRFEAEERYSNQRRVERREDVDADGQWEREYRWHKDGSAELIEQGRKGKLQRTFYSAGGVVTRIEKDSDRDGKFESIWEYNAGVLQRVTKPRGIWHYNEKGTLLRAELDEDRNGRVERIEYYQDSNRLVKVEELAANGKVRSTWHYDANGKPQRAEEDTDGDGRLDCQRRYHANGMMEQTTDSDENGVPEIRELFSKAGTLISREEDLDGDGVFDLRTGRLSDTH